MANQNVLIIGAGPSGLFAAAELARHGIQARLVERDLHMHREARATAIQPGTLEILESVGLLQPFLDSSETVHCSRLYGPGMTELGAMRYDGIDCQCTFHCSLPQYETQRILESHFVSLGGEVERGVTATPIASNSDSTTVELVHAGGRKEVVHPAFVIGAGGAKSVTRHAMNESLQGTTYRGHFLVADIAMDGPMPRHEAGVVCSTEGLLLLAPLPGGRWISFQDLEENVETVSNDEIAARVEKRLAGKHRPSHIGWSAPFRMHRRIVSRLTDGRRFLIGDAAHLSSPFGGEGLNAGLHDGHDLAWKLALVMTGRATNRLLDGYAVERDIADRHILQVSDEVHCSIVDVVTAVRKGQPVQPAVVDPVAMALARNSRSMIDVDYAGSPLVADFGAGTDGPHPGQRLPDRREFGGTSHHVLVFGPVADATALEKFARRWADLVVVTHDPPIAAARAGVPKGGVVLVRPDGHIGCRDLSTGPEAFEAVDCHLSSYLVPTN